MAVNARNLILFFIGLMLAVCPLAVAGQNYPMLVSHPPLPIKSVKVLIVFAKSRPDQINFASAATSSSQHLSMALFLRMTGLKMIHLPYKEAGQAVVDLIAGHVPLMSPSIISVLGLCSGRQAARPGRYRREACNRCTGYTDHHRSRNPGYEATQWFGIVAPTGTSGEIVDLTPSRIVRILQLPDVRERLRSNGAEPIGSTPQQFSAYIRSETAKWTKIVNSVEIKIE